MTAGKRHEAIGRCRQSGYRHSSQRLITIEGRGMLGVPGVAARTFGAVASTGTSVPLITQASSEQSICFAVPSIAADRSSLPWREPLRRSWPTGYRPHLGHR